MAKHDTQQGFTLLELIIATTILLVLSTMAVPLARLTIQREKERQLRADLWEMRDAIRPLQAGCRPGRISNEGGQPRLSPDLESLFKGVDVQGKKVRLVVGRSHAKRASVQQGDFAHDPGSMSAMAILQQLSFRDIAKPMAFH